MKPYCCPSLVPYGSFETITRAVNPPYYYNDSVFFGGVLVGNSVGSDDVCVAINPKPAPGSDPCKPATP